MGVICSHMPACEHNRTEFLMRRDGVDYVRCLGCDQVFEADDLEQTPAYEELAAEDLARVEPHRRKKAS
jgi:hypothetical protein